MLLRKVASNPVWYAVAAEQGGLISRRQLVELGLTRSEAATNVDNGRWQRVHPGVYATFTGTISPEQEVWAALLYAGRGAAACCSTALWLFGVIDQKPDALHISIPEARRVERLPDVRMHRRRALNRRDTPVHPAAAPPRIRIEESLLDECATLPEADVVGLILRAIQRRKTTPGRIEGAISARSSQPRRALLGDLLAEAEEGVASPLELHYRRRVEVPHRLPIGRRNLLDVTVSGRKRYRDVECERWRLIVELDGQEAHPPIRRSETCGETTRRRSPGATCCVSDGATSSGSRASPPRRWRSPCNNVAGRNQSVAAVPTARSRPLRTVVDALRCRPSGALTAEDRQAPHRPNLRGQPDPPHPPPARTEPRKNSTRHTGRTSARNRRVAQHAARRPQHAARRSRGNTH